MGRRSQVLTIGLVALAMLPAVPAAAKTYEPTRKDDPNPGACKPKNCSLREAISAADDHSGRDTVLLKPGRYKLGLPDPATSHYLYLSDRTTVRGKGAKKTTIDANFNDRVFLVGSGGGYLRGLTITKGATSGQQQGAGILALEGALTLDGVVVSGNASNNAGGGLFLFDSPTTIKNSRITGNQAAVGGGIESQAPLVRILRSTVSGNTAAEGAGIDLRPSQTTVPVTKITASTISGNSATNKGGGILADGILYTGANHLEDPELHVFNSTIAGNLANNDAGGVMADNLATVDIENSSIGFNRANEDQVGTAVAGGVFQHSGAIFNVDNSILAGNEVGQGGSDENCSGFFSGAGNVLSSQEGCIVSFTEPFNRYSTNPIANQLASNGGPTKTLAIPRPSAAVGFANDCPKRDQRGKRRPTNCDSGAFEERPKP